MNLQQTFQKKTYDKLGTHQDPQPSLVSHLSFPVSVDQVRVWVRVPERVGSAKAVVKMLCLC